MRKSAMVHTFNLKRPGMIFDIKLVNERTNEYAFATKAGIVIGNFKNNEDGSVSFTENQSESYLNNESVEHLFVINSSHIVAFVKGEVEDQIIIIDRKLKKAVNFINNEKGVYSSKM